VTHVSQFSECSAQLLRHASLEHRYDPPFRFTGQINKLTFKLEPEQTVGAKQ